MIESVEIENFRGIRRGALKDLGALTILTGPNGCGKSTIVDALLIAASPEPGEAIGQAVKRHRATYDGARWLIGNEEEIARVVVNSAERVSELGFRRLLDPTGLLKGKSPPYSQVRVAASQSTARALYVVNFSGDGSYQVRLEEKTNHENLRSFHVRLVDSSTPVPLDKAFSAAHREGRKSEALDLLKDLVREPAGVEILVEDDGSPMVYIDDGRSRVPASLSGDGINAFLQLSLELAASPGGLILVEEPEVFQHLRAMRQSAKALLATVRRDVQVVVTTHSLELIDAIVREANEADLARLVLFNLVLANGELKYSRLPGADVAFARESMEKDLR